MSNQAQGLESQSPSLTEIVRMPYLLQIEQRYYRVMECLRGLRMQHGTCFPRERKACTHCMCADELVKLQAEYKGPPMRLA